MHSLQPVIVWLPQVGLLSKTIAFPECLNTNALEPMSTEMLDWENCSYASAGKHQLFPVSQPPN